MLWGHNFAFHLILSGHWKERYLSSLLENRERLAKLGLFIDSRSSAWEWFQEPSQLFPLSDLQRDDFNSIVHSLPHLKLSLFIPMKEFAHIPEKGTAIWHQLSEILFPSPGIK